MRSPDGDGVRSAAPATATKNGLTLTVDRVYDVAGVWYVDLSVTNNTGTPQKPTVPNFRFYGPAGDDPHAGEPCGSS
ncbi:hypothetical protein ACFQX7_38385 [Luedemannella flava]